MSIFSPRSTATYATLALLGGLGCASVPAMAAPDQASAPHEAKTMRTAKPSHRMSRMTPAKGNDAAYMGGGMVVGPQGMQPGSAADGSVPMGRGAGGGLGTSAPTPGYAPAGPPREATQGNVRQPGADRGN